MTNAQAGIVGLQGKLSPGSGSLNETSQIFQGMRSQRGNYEAKASLVLPSGC